MIICHITDSSTSKLKYLKSILGSLIALVRRRLPKFSLKGSCITKHFGNSVLSAVLSKFRKAFHCLCMICMSLNLCKHML